ncbi:MAG: TonB-dependent receptor [Pseudomonadota bacterium]
MKSIQPTRLALAAAVAFAVSGNAVAQDMLEEVVVTAQKRTENVQDIPFSISTLSGEKLDVFTSGSEDIRLLRGRLPSLQIESSFGRSFPRFYIRGFGNPDFDLNASQPVSLVYDGIVLENPLLKGFPIFDLDRIEMLRGPQGTLFGRNTPAGTIKFESRQPTRENEGYFGASYGEDDTFRIEGAVGGPLSENWSGRFSGIYMDRSDWVDNDFTGRGDVLGGFDEYAVRGQLMYESDNFTGLFNLHARYLDGTARLFRANIIEPGSNNFNRDNYNIGSVQIDGDNFQKLETFGGVMTLEWDLGRTTFTSITGYESIEFSSRGDIDGGFGASFAPPFGPGFIPFPSETGDGIPDHDQFTQEFRLASNEWGALDWQVGFFYFNEDLTIESFSFDTLGGGVQNGFARQNQETDTVAIFGSIDYELSEDWVLQAGLRYSDDEKDFVAERLSSPIGGGPIGPLTTNPDDSEWSGDISLTWFANDNVNVYGRVARGFRAPSIQGRILFGDALSVADSETIVSIEGGVKSTLMDGRARLNFSLFSYEIDDPQLTAVGGAANFNQLLNADQSSGQGFELELEALLTEDFLVTAGVSYNDTEIEDSTLAIAPCGSGCTVLDPPGPVEGSVLIDGNPLPQAPEWIFNLTAQYTKAMGGGEFFVFGDYYWRDEVNFFLYESAEYTGDSLGELGLRIGYAWDQAEGGQEIAIFGRNITDEEELVGGIDFNNLTGFVNEPARWGIEYRINF